MRKKNPLYLTIHDARSIARYAPPGSWTMFETPDGWLAKRGQTTLTTINTLQPRYFKNLETGVIWLKRELGLLEFKVIVMPPDVPAAHPL